MSFLNKMVNSLKQKIIENYKTAFETLSNIVSGKRMNCWVKSPEYLSPSIRIQPTSLDDESGEFIHYNSICETLEKLLAGEIVEYNGLFRDAPEEIKDFFEPIKEPFNKP